jgi:hypothetical protein
MQYGLRTFRLTFLIQLINQMPIKMPKCIIITGVFDKNKKLIINPLFLASCFTNLKKENSNGECSWIKAQEAYLSYQK